MLQMVDVGLTDLRDESGASIDSEKVCSSSFGKYSSGVLIFTLHS